MAGRFTQLYAPKKPGGAKADSAQEATLVPTGTRKLYLATHKRNYLVVSELHCYAPGFPKVTPAQVCRLASSCADARSVFPQPNRQRRTKPLPKF